MKICFITGAFPNMKCGIGDYTFKLSNELAKLGNEVSVITSIKAHKDGSKNIKIYNIVKNWRFSDLKNILSAIKQISPDIVVIQYPSAEYGKNFMINFLPHIIKMKQKCRVYETIHEFSSFTNKGKFRLCVNMKSADKIIIVEEEYKDQIKKYAKISEDKFEFIPIASNIGIYNLTEEEKVQILEKNNIQCQKLISFFGFANKTKGIEEILYILKEIDDVELLFINELSEDDEYQRVILKEIKDNNLEKRIHITGFLEEVDVAKYLRTSDVCVLPFASGVSARNGSFLAAFNQNIPVVTTTDKESYEQDGVYYVRIGNREELIEKTKKALNNQQKIKRIIITWEEIAKKYINIIENTSNKEK